MSPLEKMLDDLKQRKEQDKKRFEELDENLCMCCHAYGEDKRSFSLDCFYAIHEVIPEAIKTDDGYYLRICKHCRSRLLGMLKEWWEAGIERRSLDKDHDGCEAPTPDRNIPIRVNGVTVMITQEEWEARNNN